MKLRSALVSLVVLILVCCTATRETSTNKNFNVPFEKYTLPNGLEVILHVDKSDPVVAVALTAHVGSAREKEGRTGFAHLFEHLLFLESENLGKGGLDKLSARVGGSGANGSTSRDRTNYFQTVPNDALEKMLWAEADKLGFFINTVTDEVLSKEKQVVKNEKRQSVDNQPYGHTSYVVYKNLYPADHPYNWEVIGSLEDLQNATLADVKEFFKRWYVPNNVTLTVAGDFEIAQAKQWIEKYFAEIKKGEDIPTMEKRPGSLSDIKKLYHEDNFANLPELTLTWPGVHVYHEDAHALDILTEYLSEGKKAPLYKKLVEEKQLTSSVRFNNSNSELAGELSLAVRAFADTDLNSVHEGIFETLIEFEKQGISDSDLERIKAGAEVAFYNGLSSVLGKGFQLAQYNIYTGDPSKINEFVSSVQAVKKEDVIRVYRKYLHNKPYIATSFVPKEKGHLVLKGSTKAEVVEEQIVQGAEEQFDASKAASYEKTPSSFDRTVEPAYGAAPAVKVPTIWRDSLKNGLKVLGIINEEVPMVQFTLRVRGGLYLDQPDKTGVANLLAEMMTRGTKSKTAVELEEAIQKLGASINVFATDESINITGNTLSRNYLETISLVTEMLTEPRWDENELVLAKQRVISRIQEQKANPSQVANLKAKKILYGDKHILSNDILGTEQTVTSITMSDLKNYYDTRFSPSMSSLLVVGDIKPDAVNRSLSSLSDRWKSVEVVWPEYTMPSAPEKSVVYFYDVPNAKQSQLRFFYPTVNRAHPEFYEAQVMNYILGGGGFASQLTQELREGKGYTYGISSDFSGSPSTGRFMISSGVRSNVTLEASQLVKDILTNYGPDFDDQDLEVTKGFLIKSNARAFETANSKLNMLTDISLYGWPEDYVKKREEIVKTMTVDRIRTLTEKYVRPDKMYYLVVGDAATQLKRMKDLGFGQPIQLKDPVTDPVIPR